MIELNEKDYQKKAEIIKEKIDALLDEADMAIIAQLHYSPNGIIPTISLVPKNAQNIAQDNSA